MKEQALAKTLITACHDGSLSSEDRLLSLLNRLRSRQDYVGWLVRLLSSPMCLLLPNSQILPHHPA
jgi:hypothetical protein